MELWDIYDKNRQKTGRTHERGRDMLTGDYHLVIHVWIINDKGEFLIQKRQPWKEGYPDMWDCSVAGSAILGDTSEKAAIRETKEELGIDLDMSKSELLFTVEFSRGFDDIWLVRQNVDINDIKLQYEEVADAKWVVASEIRELILKGEFIAHDYIEKIFEIAK
ncbi:NUDIX hydrolase [Clostridium sp.]|uniref:NUDIX hydrolase n=1 Tax=Clostridium sp. TaxID=1506 RepID=UPI003D6D285B